MSLLERTIFERFKEGDECAFKSYYNFLFNYAGQILKNADMAEEAVENAFINLWENRSTLIIDTSIKSYLFKSVYHNCLNQIKHLKVKERYLLYFKHHIAANRGDADEYTDYPLSRLIEKEMDLALEQALNKLPSQCREVFLLSRHDNLKNEEIAEKLGISVNTVRTQISRALSKLSTYLKEYLPLFIAWICYIRMR